MYQGRPHSSRFTLQEAQIVSYGFSKPEPVTETVTLSREAYGRLLNMLERCANNISHGEQVKAMDTTMYVQQFNKSFLEELSTLHRNMKLP